MGMKYMLNIFNDSSYCSYYKTFIYQVKTDYELFKKFYLSRLTFNHCYIEHGSKKKNFKN